MNTLYDQAVYESMVQRVMQLNSNDTPIWGKMNASQMMEHCARAFDFAVGNWKAPRMFIGYILGPIFKSSYYNDRPWPHNTKTAPSYIVTNEPEFEATRKRLLDLMKQFHEGGPDKATTHPSPFFGHLTAEQHGFGMYKHLNHHLSQFGK